MAEIVFKESSALPQRGEFTFNSLDPQELNMISDVVNWNDPQRHVGSIFQTYGRSIVLRSPSRQISDPREMLLGEYGGLQLIGAGGNPAAVREGFFNPADTIEIYPVDPTNHASELSAILQQRRIDEKGQLKMWRKAYSPMHGMDKAEADSRKEMSQRVLDFVNPFHEQGLPTQITGPKLAAEGVFPEKLDPQGEPLYFQVYRVPLIERFQTQMVHASIDQGYEAGGLKLWGCSYLMGTLLRNFHELGLAYMNGYIGNLGLIETGKKPGLFITDLGGVRDISQEPHAVRYRGFDIFMYLESVHRFLKHYSNYFTKAANLDLKQQALLTDTLKKTAGVALTEGYFASEFKEMEENEVGKNKIRSKADWRAQKLLDRHAQYSETPQRFLEFFDGFYRSLR